MLHEQDLALPIPVSAPTPASILRLRRKLQETQKLNLVLEAEHAHNAALLSQLHSLVGQPATTKREDDTQSPAPCSTPFGFLTPHVASAALRPLTTSARFTAAQLPALRSLVAELRPKVASLPSEAETVDWESSTEQRREYVDGMVRRAVSDHGVAEEGGGADLKRRVGGEEVRDLERVVHAMGGEEDMMEE